MPGFQNIQQIVDAELDGYTRYSTFRKQPTQTTSSGIWFDLSMSPGNPVPQYYASSPNISIALAQSTDGGLFHGGSVSPLQKVLRKLTVITTTATAVPLPMILMDYLLYYPFLDESVTDEQSLTNSISVPRYTDGKGVQVMAVVVAGQAGGQTFNIKYTNSDGLTGRVSRTVTTTTQAVNGTIITTDRAVAGCAGPFIPLQNGDTGVRSIESITFNTPDVGLLTLVLVKPLVQTIIMAITAPTEVDYLKDFSIMPVIKDDAYLNCIVLPQGTLAAAPIHGDLTVVWK